MSIIQSELSTSSADFREKKATYDSLVAELRNYQQQARKPETPEGIQLARSRNKLLVEERLARLVDPGSSWLEIASLAGMEMYGDLPPGAGIRTVVGQVAGRPTVIVANNPAIKGGTYYPLTVKKHLRAQEIALENHLPCIYLVDSGGAFLPMQAEVFPDRFHFGRIFYHQAQLSSHGVPQIAVVLGSCTAGGAYVPAMSDESIMVRGNSTIFLGGPPLVKAATGVDVSAEELGGAEVHTSKSGVADHLAENEDHALQIARQISATFSHSPTSHIPRLMPTQSPEEPRYDPAEIYGIVGGDLKKAFPMREVIARLVDGSRFDEFKANYAPTILCGFAHIGGFLVGIIANDGILFSETALKATHFIELCDQRGIPLLFLQNIVGFMVGKDYEHGGIAKDGAKMVTAVSTARVPKFTLLLGGSFGAGNYGMCGRAFEPRFLFSWPNSRISVMGGTQAARVLSQVRYASKPDTKREDIENFEDEIFLNYEREGSPYFATARMWDDGVIDPVETRTVLTQAFAASARDTLQTAARPLFRM